MEYVGLPSEAARMFFGYLREASWRVGPRATMAATPHDLLMHFILRNPWPMHIAALSSKHMKMDMGLCPAMVVMPPTVMPPTHALDGHLSSNHILGAEIAGNRRTSEQRVFAQLGTVMVHTNGHHKGQRHLQLQPGWHRTSFVLAAEIDELGKAGSLWLLYNAFPNPCTPPLHHYPMFDLYRISRPSSNYVQNQVFELYCGPERWQQRTIDNPKGHLG
ncbi:hypothetical protein Daus18300_000812, partial [Diaporthe australafricana]